MPPKLLADLPADVVQHILGRLTLAHHIARIAPTCKVVSVAARNAMKVRKFSGEVVTLVGHNVMSVAAAPDGRIVTGSSYKTLKVWRNGACERTIQAHIHEVTALAVLPGGARFVSAATAPPPRSCGRSTALATGRPRAGRGRPRRRRRYRRDVGVAGSRGLCDLSSNQSS